MVTALSVLVADEPNKKHSACLYETFHADATTRCRNVSSMVKHVKKAKKAKKPE